MIPVYPTYHLIKLRENCEKETNARPDAVAHNGFTFTYAGL